MSVPSPTLSPTSAPEAFMMSMKPGCRGDPRMNRAVAAKLKNPHISLFDALDIGGFTYPRNVDAATMDNDRVTLGQRKNQLNRRLRLARQNMQKAEEKKKGGKSTTKKEPAKGKVSGTSPLVIANSYLRQKRSQASKTKPAATKRAAPVTVEQPSLKKQCLHVVSSSNTTTASSPAHSPGITLNTALNQTMTTTRELGSVSPVADDASTISSNLPSANSTVSHTANNAVQADDTWWPTNLNFLNGEASQNANLVLADFPVVGSVQDVTRALVMDNKRTVSTNSFVSQATDIQQQVADNTSFQLLGQNSLIAGQLVGELRQALPEDPNAEIRREELGLKIFQSGLQDLYKKSMVQAGFTPQEAAESSQSFHKFAFQAWKNECERLQVLLQADNGEQS